MVSKLDYQIIVSSILTGCPIHLALVNNYKQSNISVCVCIGVYINSW